jgi:hypothetical protein
MGALCAQRCVRVFGVTRCRTRNAAIPESDRMRRRCGAGRSPCLLPLSTDEVTVGRHKDCAIVMKSAGVDRV